MKFQGKSDDNRKLTTNWEMVNLYVSRWKPHTSFDIEIVRHEPKISDPMRRYYFSTVLPGLMKGCGYDPEEDEIVHYFLKGTFFRCERDERGMFKKVPSVFGNKSDIPISVKHEFVEWVRRKAAENGEYIEGPKRREKTC